ncbi:hypothetical protein FACS1894202_03620 [Clostridia bacterium]|nr:hypothetical protein FACS1894202_03620 [Clostridia bacterium]
MTNKEIENAAMEYRKYKKLADDAADEADKIKETLVSELEAQNTDVMATELFVISNKTVMSTNFDTKMFKTKCPELYKAFSSARQSRRFTVA